jgi:cell division transport system permease protein
MLSVLSITTIAFSLFAFGLFSLVAVNIRKTLSEVESRVEIRAFLADGTQVEVVSAAMGDIGAFPEVSRVEYVSPDSALARARSELGEFKDVFESAFLPASIDVRMREGHRDPATVKTVASRIKSFEFVDDVRYGEMGRDKLYRTARRDATGSCSIRPPPSPSSYRRDDQNGRHGSSREIS